ncbi:MAG: N-acetylneuraminate synthase [Clostridia bacterium]|nr:N-acetylneuraminate synthase [Clostridia bacterium]
MKNDRCLIIAEAGVNHNGSFDLAIKLCDAAKKAGADAVKFQTFTAEKLITHSVAQADYQSENTGSKESQFDMLKKLELSFESFEKIKKHCDDIGIVFASTAFDPDGLDFLVNLGMPFIKVGSGEMCNVPFLRYIGSKKLPVIIGTGMSTIGDVDLSVNALRQGGADDITLLHCTTNYPCPYEEVNLNAMLTLEKAFGLPVGYSDHTVGSEVPVAAVALGAKVIEKHFTLDRNMEGPDHKASTEPGEFAEMIRQIRNVEKSLGSFVKRPTDSEIGIKKVVTKRIVAKRRTEIGETFDESNICVKRNDTGIEAKYWDMVIGKKASRVFLTDQGIDF